MKLNKNKSIDVQYIGKRISRNHKLYNIIKENYEKSNLNLDYLNKKYYNILKYIFIAAYDIGLNKENARLFYYKINDGFSVIFFDKKNNAFIIFAYFEKLENAKHPILAIQSIGDENE